MPRLKKNINQEFYKTFELKNDEISLIEELIIQWAILNFGRGTTKEWAMGVISLVLGIIQYSKRKKQFDEISKTEDEPLSVLQMRLAKGEITKE